jgi:DNA-binding response OmpR family regulator
MASTELAVTPTAARLTRKEKELFKLLAENPDSCFSRQFLLERIWGYSADARTRTVDVHILRLRKKLQDNPHLKILTVFREGYVLKYAGDDRQDDWAAAQVNGPSADSGVEETTEAFVGAA